VPTPIHIDQGGDTIASARPIDSTPFTDSGTTAGYVDNYAPNCGFAGGAPDVVYSISPAMNGALDVSLCGSAYDTELYVYQDGEGSIIRCNDDSCGLQSQVHAPVTSGHTYYIIVDGYYNSSGQYAIVVNLMPGCCLTACPPNSVLEGEPVCGDNYLDSYNGGCGSTPPVFSAIPLVSSYTVCGQYGGFYYAGLSYRDTDWYELRIPPGESHNITWTVRGETQTLVGIIDGNAGCPVTSFYVFTSGTCATDLSVSAVLPPGTWWLWASPQNYGLEAGPCGQHYTARLSCPDCSVVAVEPGNWGWIKSVYR
jgi:hypothetical protein